MAKEAVLLLKEGVLDAVAICEVDGKRLESFKFANAELLKDLVNVKYYSDIDDAIKDGINFAHICTQNSIHLEMARKMMQNKIPFIVEKPVSDKLAEIDQIEELANANPNVIAKNGLVFRFDNSMKGIKEIYGSGALGKVYFVRFYWEFSRQYMEGVDIIWDLMPHLVDIFHFITGEKSHLVSGSKTQFRRKSGAELGTIVLETDSGVKGIFNVSWFSTRKNRLIEVFGDKKILGADLLSQSVILYDSNDLAKSEAVTIVKNNTIRDELMNLIADAQSGRNTVNNIEIGIDIARYLDKIDRESKDF